MPRTGSTGARGYGTLHVRATRKLKEQMRAHGGAHCARGGEWMEPWQLDLPRTDPRSVDGDHVGLPVGWGGTSTDALSCAHHNRQHGARMGNLARGRMPKLPERGKRAQVLVTSRDW